ncbi:Peptide-N4-(N-acetyl-beta-glucosaminyl)asparagine amidase A [Neolecta irregularis DAH-3]|uniref:Peptide-N4-(N-acetyl-beta-glucosaminyl)asparagine amidase A n=1 Tax=Neolecta irregularis (strain DAH-3) TaxID=1198029 RepID=A0A1U7LW24_NEOID|nr:Peptide-N4-(N-acetyl-beta-glucosaminyl)asparagine amidase A [Neolecta irregularis DAH-3]|eukprot:OLL26867.1 Peptide-N4-(N-acetyl-beta-glucosaminyl)asparagine amidase A [Neolecta irregularis DAH-3]
MDLLVLFLLVSGVFSQFEKQPEFTETFEVKRPFQPPAHAIPCTMPMAQVSIPTGDSRWAAFSYSPTCGTGFDSVYLNLTMVAKGRQYDRLGWITVNGIEIWRTSTAEPSKTGIYTNFIKDVSYYRELFRSDAAINFTVDNYISSVNPAILNFTLTAMFFTSQDVQPAESKPSFVPLFDVFTSNNRSVSVSFPRNLISAELSILASGNGDDEFWYTNAPDNYTDTFGTGSLQGGGSLREVRCYIDNKLVGSYIPDVVIFTGGVNPYMWKPIMGIESSDLYSHRISLDAWIPLLVDSRRHVVRLEIIALPEILEDWYNSAHIKLWQSSNPSDITRGSISTITNTDLDVKQEVVLGLKNTSLAVHTSASRMYSISSTLIIAGNSRQVGYTQTMYYDSKIKWTDSGLTQSINQEVSSSTVFLNGSSSSTYQPLEIYSAISTSKNGTMRLEFDINRSLTFSNPSEYNHQWGSAVSTFSSNGSLIRGSETMNQHLKLDDYDAYFKAEHGKLVLGKPPDESVAMVDPAQVWASLPRHLPRRLHKHPPIS